jgi:hypothetical protein
VVYGDPSSDERDEEKGKYGKREDIYDTKKEDPSGLW